jgi:hypothetical protein
LAKVYVEVEVEPGVALHRVAAQHEQLRQHQQKTAEIMANNSVVACEWLCSQLALCQIKEGTLGCSGVLPTLLHHMPLLYSMCRLHNLKSTAVLPPPKHKGSAEALSYWQHGKATGCA